MPYRPRRSWIERKAVELGLISGERPSMGAETGQASVPLQRFPTPDQWDNFTEFDAREWPRRPLARRYRLVPTTCFNCESACGLLAYIDKETGAIRKFEGNPVLTAAAHGQLTVNQWRDPFLIQEMDQTYMVCGGNSNT